MAKDKYSKGSPYTPSLGDKFWHAVWLSGRSEKELEQDFHYAAMVGKLWRAEYLLNEKKVNIASGDNFAVRWAANGGHADMLALLFRHAGVDANARDGEALIRAASLGHHAAAAVLLEHGADPARQDFKSLRAAYERKDMAMLAQLLPAAPSARPLVAEWVAALRDPARPPEAGDAAQLRLFSRYLSDGVPPPDTGGAGPSLPNPPRR